MVATDDAKTHFLIERRGIISHRFALLTHTYRTCIGCVPIVIAESMGQDRTPVPELFHLQSRLLVHQLVVPLPNGDHRNVRDVCEHALRKPQSELLAYLLANELLRQTVRTLSPR